MMDLRENLYAVSTTGHSQGYPAFPTRRVNAHIHRSQGSATQLVDLGVGRGQHAAFATKAFVPPFLVEMHIPWVDLVEKAGVSDMDLVWRDTNDGPLSSGQPLF
jgi:hypothetical protein